MTASYVSILTSDSYLPGLIALHKSLQRVASSNELIVLITDGVGSASRALIAARGIQFIEVPAIRNPTDIAIDHRWHPTYSKLHCFGLEQFDKIVFLDADTLVVTNIDDLFQMPHMAAVSAGSMLPEYSNWTNLNSGMFVAEPSTILFSSMCAMIGTLESLESGGSTQTPRRGSDQDFLNAFYPAWRTQPHLHLDHKYNMIHYHLDAYNSRLGYTLSPGDRQVAVLHFASQVKPWDPGARSTSSLGALEREAIQLWVEVSRLP